jgi:hypothetical protein
MEIPKADEVVEQLRDLGDLNYVDFVKLQLRVTDVLTSIVSNPSREWDCWDWIDQCMITEEYIKIPWRIEHHSNDFECPKLVKWLRKKGYFPVFMPVKERYEGYAIYLKIYFNSPSSYD